MRTKKKGFTLVEVLIIAPILILFIGGFVSLLVTLTGESLVLREKNAAAYDTQAALDDMEASIKQAVDIRTTTGSVPVPQGNGNSTSVGTPFTNENPEALILSLAATSAAANNSSRELIYTGASPCSTQNPLYIYYVVYFVQGQDLFKRTILPSIATCSAPIQRGSCIAERLAAYPAVCKAIDEKVASGVTSMTLSYFTGSQAITDAQADAATDVLVTMTIERRTAGKSATYSGSVRAGSLNI